MILGELGGVSAQTSRGARTFNSGGVCTWAPGSAALRQIFLFGVTFILPGPSVQSFVIRLFRLSLSIIVDNYHWEEGRGKKERSDSQSRAVL